jgi:capsular polysaccharide biosynthesis protein
LEGFPERFIHCTAPLALKELHVPSPTMLNRNHAFSAHVETHCEIAEKICDASSARSNQPLYISRRRLPDLHRKIVNEEKFEHALQNAGVRIVCPEQLPFEEQVRLFNEHTVFMGCIGSGFHSLLFNLRSEIRTVVLCDQAINTNYLIVDTLKNIDATYIRCLSVERQSNKIDPDRVLDVQAALEGLREIGLRC